MSTALTVKINTSAIDSVVGGAATFTTMDVANDKLIFSAGSTVVADGLAIPSQTDYNQAGTIISADADVVVAKCFLADATLVAILKEVHLWGDADGRYVFAFSFDGATASEPVLEIWDDSNLNTTANLSLGDGTPANSWWKGVVTNLAAPAHDWTETALAGNGVGRYLQLNNGSGALAVATVLYCNLKIIIPQATSTSGQETPVVVCKYTTN